MEPSSVQSQLAYFKYPDTPGVEILLAKYGKSGNGLFTVIVQRNNPAPGDENATGWWYESVVAHLVSRGLLYISSVSGNTCQAGKNLPPAGGAARGVSAVGGMATVGIASVQAISAVGGASSLGFAAAGTALGATLGFATLGLGLTIGPIMAIIQHHGQAVQAEDNTICGVSTFANQTITQIDQAVASGSITAAQGIQAMRALVTQLNVNLNSVSGRGSGSHPCNAGCVYQAVLKAHLDFALTFYVDLSPMTQKQMPVAPGTYAPNAASAPIVAALAMRGTSPGSDSSIGSPTLTGTFANADSPNLNAAGSQNGTFSSIPNILTIGTGTAAPVAMSSSVWIILIGLAALAGFFLLHKA